MTLRGTALRDGRGRPPQGPLGVLLPGFDGVTLPDWLAQRLRNGLAGVCLFGPNVVDRVQLRELTDEIRAANPLAIIAIDEEGGDVTRLYDSVGSPYPGTAILGRIDDPDYTAHVARIVGWELRLAGVNLDFAPDVDINSNSDNPVIGVRSFGTEPALVARHSSAWVAGLESTGVAACAKHFPGHGDTAEDSHLALPVVDRSLDEMLERELVPFAAAIAAGTRTIMTSHIVVPQLDERPATFSSAILGGLLRDRLGFTGVIVSDALDMVGASGEIGIPEAAVRAIAAGCDLLCIGTDNTAAQLDEIETALVAAVVESRLDDARLQNAIDRVASLAVDLQPDAAHIPIPEYITSTEEPEFDLARTVAAFDGIVSVSSPTFITLETRANIAVGASPWGIGAVGTNVIAVYEGDALTLSPEASPVLIGKANHRYEWVRRIVDDTRRSHPSTIVIDMGWPSDDRRYADIATFGASRHVGQALLAALESNSTMKAESL
jgi:beta-N-acetylhexosaminidase